MRNLFFKITKNVCNIWFVERYSKGKARRVNAPLNCFLKQSVTLKLLSFFGQFRMLFNRRFFFLRDLIEDF